MSQLFKKTYERDKLDKFLEQICSKNKKYYLLNKESYKRAQLLNLIVPLIADLNNYYHQSKQFYILRVAKYAHFVTIIRQICRSNDIMWLSSINYNKSKYAMSYFIYL